MKLILVVFVIFQFYGVFANNVPQQEERGLIDIWDFLNPIAMPIAQGIDSTLAVIGNINDAVTNAVTNAVHGVTTWIGGLIPPLGKRDLDIELRLNLLNELQAFLVGFKNSVVEILKSFLNGNIQLKIRQVLTKLVTYIQIHLQSIKELITNLIPTIQNTIGTQALTSSLNLVQVLEQVIQKIQALFSS